MRNKMVNECPICLQPENGCFKLDCGHHLHKKCWEKWKCVSSTCPICRQNCEDKQEEAGQFDKLQLTVCASLNVFVLLILVLAQHINIQTSIETRAVSLILNILVLSVIILSIIYPITIYLVLIALIMTLMSLLLYNIRTINNLSNFCGELTSDFEPI